METTITTIVVMAVVISRLDLEVTASVDIIPEVSPRVCTTARCVGITHAPVTLLRTAAQE